jgi:hypothetical protein
MRSRTELMFQVVTLSFTIAGQKIHRRCSIHAEYRDRIPLSPIAFWPLATAYWLLMLPPSRA